MKRKKTNGEKRSENLRRKSNARRATILPTSYWNVRFHYYFTNILFSAYLFPPMPQGHDISKHTHSHFGFISTLCRANSRSNFNTITHMNVCGFMFSNRYKTNSLKLVQLQRHTSTAFYSVRVSCVFHLKLLNISVTVCNSGHFLNCGETFGSTLWLWLMHCTCKHCLVHSKSKLIPTNRCPWMFCTNFFSGFLGRFPCQKQNNH